LCSSGVYTAEPHKKYAEKQVRRCWQVEVDLLSWGCTLRQECICICLGRVQDVSNQQSFTTRLPRSRQCASGATQCGRCWAGLFARVMIGSQGGHSRVAEEICREAAEALLLGPNHAGGLNCASGSSVYASASDVAIQSMPAGLQAVYPPDTTSLTYPAFLTHRRPAERPDWPHC
jgi:hypothetical protein